VRFPGADAVAARGPVAAVQAITNALRGGPGPARVSAGLTDDQFLLMPSQTLTAADVKAATAAG
jgi:hypothetical protein